MKESLSYVIFAALALLLPLLILLVDIIIAEAVHVWVVMLAFTWFGAGMAIGMAYIK